MNKKYDVIIVGGGPSGIFAALELAKASSLKVLLIEKGRDIDGRECPARDGGNPCISCSPCHLVCGVGGAGAFSDGKLTLSPQVGGRLVDYLGESNTQTLIKYVDDVYLSFVLPYRHLTGILEMLQAMDKLVPGVASHHTLLYGVEVKFYSNRLQLSSSLETEVGNMFAVGDGAGVSRGLIQSSVSGIVAAREILRRSGCRAGLCATRVKKMPGQLEEGEILFTIS